MILVGRVLTSIVKIIYNKGKEIENFILEDYFQLESTDEKFKNKNDFKDILITYGLNINKKGIIKQLLKLFL
ncbi:hypothetical protein [Clostridium massiliamazoniense]|uniref:hypothetical protein n=1 Tax=Clostridium massiliamazoniense TaxID=1347366 RepID=UPI0006D7C170|nr:hypothetical protein [Clostridium massiliamazoniense]